MKSSILVFSVVVLLTRMSSAADVLSIDDALRIARDFVSRKHVDLTDAEITSAHIEPHPVNPHDKIWRIRWELQGSRRAKGAWTDIAVTMRGEAWVIYGK